MNGGSCIRGDSAANLTALMAPDGVGKIMLGQRRLGHAALLDAAAAELAAEQPGLKIYEIRGPAASLREEVGTVPAGAVLLIYEPKQVPGLDEQAAALPPGTAVLCGQELCHQVPAVYRLR